MRILGTTSQHSIAEVERQVPNPEKHPSESDESGRGTQQQLKPPDRMTFQAQGGLIQGVSAPGGHSKRNGGLDEMFAQPPNFAGIDISVRGR